jgi:hypothetical protein
VQTVKAAHKQTKYCVECARIKKRENSLDPWTPEERRAYMRKYMRGYRAHARLCCLIWLLSFENFMEGINYAELLAIKLAGLGWVLVVCIRHLKHAWKDKDEDKGK